MNGGLGRGGVGSCKIGRGGALLARGSVTPGILEGSLLVWVCAGFRFLREGRLMNLRGNQRGKGDGDPEKG